jgi:hypothetical protein
MDNMDAQRNRATSSLRFSAAFGIPALALSFIGSSAVGFFFPLLLSVMLQTVVPQLGLPIGYNSARDLIYYYYSFVIIYLLFVINSTPHLHIKQHFYFSHPRLKSLHQSQNTRYSSQAR